MASGTSCYTSPESRALREHFSDLLDAMCDPLGLSAKLFSNNLINDETMKRARLMPQTDKEKSFILLDEVLQRVKAQPRLFRDFVKVLNKDEMLRKEAKTLEATLSK